jgi:hypothetical protein
VSRGSSASSRHGSIRLGARLGFSSPYHP